MKKLQKIFLATFLIGGLLASALFTQGHEPVKNSENSSFVKGLPYLTAGSDATICDSKIFKTQGESGSVGTTIWGTSGDGYFNNPFDLSTGYEPGPQDVANGQVTLKLIVIPGPGTNPLMDEMVLYLNRCENIRPDEQ